MNKNEYFSNSYRALISNKYLHFIISDLEYLLTLTAQIIIYNTDYCFENNNKISDMNFHFLLLNILNKISLFSTLIVILIFFLTIPIYYFIYNKYSFKKNCTFNIIIMNIFEIVIFRLLSIIIFHFIFFLKGILLFIFILLSIPMTSIIIINFFYNHLYYFSLHFVNYPYDYYSSYIDIVHLIEKILISISLHTSINSLNKFLFIFVFLLQILSFLFSIYIMKYKSFYFMNNIFINKSRFSLILSNLIINFIMVITGKNNIIKGSFVFIIFNAYIIIFVIVQIFYNPYKYIYFDNNENINNIYFYFFIIDHIKNESYNLEEKLSEHYSLCGDCELCYNLQLYLMNKVNYNKMYKILYKNIGPLSRIINELIYILLKKGKKYLKNNSYFLISIIYCYYIYYNKKNYCLCSNLKIIYELINEENINILENHLVSTEQILLINEFLNKADNILDNIQEIINEKIFKIKVEKFFDLMGIIFDLKNIKYRKKLYFNKNEGIINFYRYISICTMIYEEIFNTTLSNNSISLKENQLFLDDLSNKNNNELNQIIIELDVLNFENKIIYILGEFAKYKNNNLCKLFPNIFRSKQLLIIKQKILNSKYFQCKENEDEQNNLNNKVIQSQFIDFQFIINDNEEGQNKFKMINLRLNLIYPLNISKKILLAGIYSIENNIIITLDKSSKEKNIEYILNIQDSKNYFENRNDSVHENNKLLIKFKKNEKYYNNKKLVFIAKYFINPNNYNIYYILSLEKQKTHKEEMDNHGRNSTKSLFFEDSKNKMGSETNQNTNYLIQSTSMSTFVQISNDKQNLKKRNKNESKENKKKNFFKYYQIYILIFSLIILLFQIICHKSLVKINNDLEYQNKVFINYKNFHSVFNQLYTSVLSLACLADESKGESCSSIFALFERFYNGEKGRMNLKIIRYNQNKGLSNVVNLVKHNFIENLAFLQKKELLDLIYSPIEIYSFTQNILQNNVKLILHVENQSFVDVLDYMTNGFLIMTSKFEYINDIIYIIDKINISNPSDSSFNNIKLNGQLSQYQYYFYYSILNYQSFIQYCNLISLKLSKIINLSTSNMVQLYFFYIILNIILYLILFLSISIYIRNYLKLITDVLDETEKKLNLRNDNISVEEMFLQKIKKLKIIISLYKQDIYQAIVDLNFIYDNYKKFIEEKNKELAKYLKKEKYINDSNNNIIEKSMKEMKFQKIIKVPQNKKHFYYILILLSFMLVLNLCQFIIWISYYSVYLRIINGNVLHSQLIDDSYKLLNYYQLMIFHNYTVDDINEFENYNKSLGEDLFSKMYTDLQNLYAAKKILNKLKKYNLGNIDSYYNYTCLSYYNYLLETDKLKNPDIRYKDYLMYVCEDSNIFKYNNYKLIFSLLYEQIQIGINEINNHSYEGLIKVRNSLYFQKIIVYYLTIYNFALEVLGKDLQRKSYEKIISLKGRYINIGYSLYYIFSFIIILIIIIGYIRNINSNINKIYELKKVFKVCNKKG